MLKVTSLFPTLIQKAMCELQDHIDHVQEKLLYLHIKWDSFGKYKYIYIFFFSNACFLTNYSEKMKMNSEFSAVRLRFKSVRSALRGGLNLFWLWSCSLTAGLTSSFRHEMNKKTAAVTMCHSPWQPQGALWLCSHCLVGRAGSAPCFCRQEVG